MADLQERYDDAMFAYSQGQFDVAIAGLQGILAEDPAHFDAQLALAMCHYRKGDFATAIAEGHKAEKLRPNEQLVHTNLSLFYMKSGDKTTAEKHGLQARIASWKEGLASPAAANAAGAPAPAPAADAELQMAQPKPKSFKLPEKFPDMPWKKQQKLGGPGTKATSPSPAPPPTSTPPASRKPGEGPA